jgi:hypothetical protein
MRKQPNRQISLRESSCAVIMGYSSANAENDPPADHLTNADTDRRTEWRRKI